MHRDCVYALAAVLHQGLITDRELAAVIGNARVMSAIRQITYTADTPHLKALRAAGHELYTAMVSCRLVFGPINWPSDDAWKEKVEA